MLTGHIHGNTGPDFGLGQLDWQLWSYIQEKFSLGVTTGVQFLFGLRDQTAAHCWAVTGCLR